MHKNVIHIFIFFLIIQVQNAQSTRLLNIEDGLSNNIVYDIQKDDKGFLWFATENGLNRYDGYSFQKFHHNSQDSTSIASNVCRNILKDKKGNLWIATKKGISLFDEITETFQNFKNPTKDLDIKELELIGSNKIWFNTLGSIGFFDIEKKEYHFLNNSESSYSMTSNQEKVWVSSTNGSLDYSSINNLKFNNLHQNLGVRKQIYFGNFTHKLWLPKANYSSEKEYLIIPELPNNAKPNKLLEVDVNTLLIGSNQGLFKYKIDTKELTKVKLTENVTTLNQQVRSIYKDDIGNLWIGTIGGVFHIDYYKKSFQHLQINKNADDIIMGLSSDKNHLYINEFGKAIYKYSLKAKTFEKLTFSKENLFIWDIKKVKQNPYALWLASDSGLICYNPNTKKSRNIPLSKGKDFYNNSFNLFDLNDDFMWVASHTGIHKVSKKENGIKAVLSKVDIVIESSVQKILAVKHLIFIATEGKGLFLYDENTDEIKPIYQHKNGVKEIINPTIWDMILVDDKIWLGTNEGLYIVDVKSLEVGQSNITKNIIFSIQKDNFNRLWMGTDKGLMSYNLKTNYADFFTKEEGVLNTEFNRRSKTKTNDNQLWFGGVKGLTYFNPSEIKQNTVVPKTHITKLEIITPDSTFTFNHRKEKKVVLPYNQNTISLEYVALNYTNSTQNKYKYQLVGRDVNWVEDKGNRFSRYTQLPPGKYSFKVIAANNDGVWNTKGAELSIEILPPFWKTVWFQILVFLTIIGIIYTAYYYRVKRLLEIERMKLRIASDLHDEVGSGLSGIALTSDILEQQFQNGTVKPHLLSRITKNARNLAATLDDIVWLINPEKETLEDFLLKTKTLTKELLENKNIHFEDDLNQITKQKLLSAAQKRNLFLFVKEVVNNIAKHADAQNINVVFKVKNKNLLLNITDDGVGFDISIKTSRNGIISLKNRANILKGKFLLLSEKGKGTKVSLQIKIP
ncbi:ligand-binding sensor domain-containing protein [Polaribacter porphyrae]|uniref:Histidine kinase domain-containing protein n=1 Tax=Polaribacter porphyrae TaxID=1137780 RepID=A0A2S7WS72_9FLAO|nr:sensor histidine kinase [Polaribacter porphyrae]PQJ80434.1 hypothetical protein BTO18_15195 [Polaribacter porphyrae]